MAPAAAGEEPAVLLPFYSISVAIQYGVDCVNCNTHCFYAQIPQYYINGDFSTVQPFGGPFCDPCSRAAQQQKQKELDDEVRAAFGLQESDYVCHDCRQAKDGNEFPPHMSACNDCVLAHYSENVSL